MYEYLLTWYVCRKCSNRHDITEILLKVALNTITLTPNPRKCSIFLGGGGGGGDMSCHKEYPESNKVLVIKNSLTNNSL